MTISKKKKEKKLCWLGLYVLADKALLPHCIKTNQGHFHVEPIQEVDYRNRSELIEALERAIEMGNPSGEAPPRGNQKERTPMEVLAKAKSWRDLERKSIYFSIMTYPSDIHVEAWGRASNGTWSEEKDTALDVRIPASSGAEGIADTILDHLKTRNDLPGLPLAQSA